MSFKICVLLNSTSCAVNETRRTNQMPRRNEQESKRTYWIIQNTENRA